MSEPGAGSFHVYYTDGDGVEHRKAYLTWGDADKARNFLESLGIFPEIDMHTKKKEWDKPTEGESNE